MQGLGGGALEDNILAMLCYSEAHAHRISMEVPISMYSTRQYRQIAERATAYLHKYHTPPRAHLRDLFEAELIRVGDEGNFYRAIIKSIEEIADELQADYVFEQLDRWLSRRTMEERLSVISDLLDADNVEEALEQFRIPGQETRSKDGVWFKDTDRWLSFLDPVEEGEYSAGIDTLDEYHVALNKRETLLFIAPAGRGKSWYLIEVGRRAFLRRRNVLHISVENSLEICQQRWTQTLLGLARHEVTGLPVTLFDRPREDYRDDDRRYRASNTVTFRRDTVSPQDIPALGRDKIVERLEPLQRRGGVLRIDWFPAGMLSVRALDSHLEMLAINDQFRPDVVILDFLDQMALDSKNLRISKGQVYRELRGLAGVRNFALFTATQGNRDSATKRLVTGVNVSEDWSVIGTADIVLTYSQTNDEFQKRLARVLVDKARNAKDKWIALIAQNYDTGQFCLDSVYFNDHWEEADRFINPEREEEA